MQKITVCGAGSWGTALAIVLADNGHQVRLWTHRASQAENINHHRFNKPYLDIQIPDNIQAYHQLEEAVKGTNAVVLVVPTKAIREVCQKLNPLLKAEDITLIHASKGIEPKTFKRVSQMIEEELTEFSYRDLVVLSGPSHAEEVAERQPTTVTVSSLNSKERKFAQDLFFNESFRVYTSSDVIGIELGGALKNIIALGAGISDGLGYGDNAKAALMTRGLAEITRLGTALGANPLTFLGLPGVGDLFVTCTSKHSRNWQAGYLLGRGHTLEDVLNQMKMVVEGIRTTEAAYELAKEKKIEMPITTGIYQVIYDGKTPKEIVGQLMNRDKREELDDFASLLRN